jgi:hypothetical protein
VSAATTSRLSSHSAATHRNGTPKISYPQKLLHRWFQEIPHAVFLDFVDALETLFGWKPSATLSSRSPVAPPNRCGLNKEALSRMVFNPVRHQFGACPWACPQFLYYPLVLSLHEELDSTKQTKRLRKPCAQVGGDARASVGTPI